MTVEVGFFWGGGNLRKAGSIPVVRNLSDQGSFRRRELGAGYANRRWLSFLSLRYAAFRMSHRTGYLAKYPVLLLEPELQA